jgi:hypothetical protein
MVFKKPKRVTDNAITLLLEEMYNAESLARVKEPVKTDATLFQMDQYTFGSMVMSPTDKSIAPEFTVSWETVLDASAEAMVAAGSNKFFNNIVNN